MFVKTEADSFKPSIKTSAAFAKGQDLEILEEPEYEAIPTAPNSEDFRIQPVPLLQQAGTYLFEHDIDGNLTEAGEEKFSKRYDMWERKAHVVEEKNNKVKRDWIKDADVLKSDGALAMQSYFKTIGEDVRTIVENNYAVEFHQYKTLNLVHSLSVLLRVALSAGNANGGNAALGKVLNPNIGTAVMDLEGFCQQLHTNCTELRQHFGTPEFPNGISFSQLAAHGLLTNLDPTYDGVFKALWLQNNKTGITSDFASFVTAFHDHRDSKTGEEVALMAAEGKRKQSANDDRQLSSLIAAYAKSPSGLQSLLAAIKANPVAHSGMVAMIAAHKPPTPAASASNGKKCAQDGCTKTLALTSPYTYCLTHDPSDRAKAVREKLTADKKVGDSSKAHVASADASHVGGVNPTLPYLSLSSALRHTPTPALAPTLAAYWDNADSVNLTPNFTGMYNVQAIEPFYIGGVGSGIPAIAQGCHPALPEGMNLIYHTPDASTTLFSIGYLCRHGWSTTQDATGLRVFDANKEIVDHSPMLPNNLCPIGATFLSTTRSSPATEVNSDLYENAFKAGWPEWLTAVFKPEAIAFHAAADPNKFYTKEQLARADEVERLHHIHMHLGDAALGTALDHGVIRTDSRLTSQDVAINRLLRLNCPQCTEAKIKHPSYYPSTNQPADGVGDTLSLDLEQLPDSVYGGYTHQLMIVDETTGTIGIQGCTSKEAPDVLAAFLKYVNKDYVAFGHKTRHLTADAEKVFAALVPHFGKHGYELTLFPPGQHAQRLERHQQTLLNSYIATMAGIPFYFPTKYTLHLKNAVAFALSLLPTTKTTPQSPYELRTGHRFAQHRDHSTISIGSTCIVHRGDPARRSNAAQHDQTHQSTTRGELGVCMGFSKHFPGSYDFLLGSGKIEPRRILELVKVDSPFGFKRREVHRTYIDTRPRVLPAPATAELPHEPVDVFPEHTPLVGEELADVLFEADDTAVPISILSHEHVGPGTSDHEFKVQYSDGAIRYHYRPEIASYPFYAAYKDAHLRTRRAAAHPVPVSTPTRSSARLQHRPLVRFQDPVAEIAGVPASHPNPIDDQWTRVSSRNRRGGYPLSSLPLPQGEVTPSYIAAATPRLRSTGSLPRYLELVDEDDFQPAEDLPFDWPMAVQVQPPSPLVDDLDWYQPISSPIPASTRYADLPLPNENMPYGEPLPAVLQMPPDAIRQHYTSDKAFAIYPAEATHATAKEMDKYFKTFDVCRLGEEVHPKDIPAGALKQYNRIFFAAKYKADGSFDRFSGRCFTDGSRQPDGTYVETYAGTGDGVDKFAMVAAYHARDAGRLEQGLDSQLSTFSFDITGAFLQGRLTEENCPQPAYIHFAHDIRHECAGKWYRRYASTYGTKDANAIFDKTFVDTAAQAGFYPNTEDPKIFAKIHPTDPSLSCAVSMHVDDGLGCCTYEPYKEELRRVLTDRFGDLDWDDHPKSNTGINITHYTDGSYSLDQHGYLLRMLTDFGATDLPFVSSPSLPYLFDAPTDMTPVNVKAFRKMVGALRYLQSTYHLVRKEVQHLQSRTQSDLDKVIRVLAYLNCHRGDYVRYSGSDYQV
jgi:hypothetical protein